MQSYEQYPTVTSVLRRNPIELGDNLYSPIITSHYNPPFRKNIFRREEMANLRNISEKVATMLDDFPQADFSSESLVLFDHRNMYQYPEVYEESLIHGTVVTDKMTKALEPISILVMKSSPLSNIRRKFIASTSGKSKGNESETSLHSIEAAFHGYSKWEPKGIIANQLYTSHPDIVTSSFNQMFMTAVENIRDYARLILSSDPNKVRSYLKSPYSFESYYNAYTTYKELEHPEIPGYICLDDIDICVDSPTYLHFADFVEQSLPGFVEGAEKKRDPHSIVEYISLRHAKYSLPKRTPPPESTIKLLPD